MKTNRLTARLLPLLAAFALLGSAHAQTTSAVPDYLSYQGRALNADGSAIGGGTPVTPVNRTITFRVWNHPSNGLVDNLIYSEQQVVTIANGEFSALIGAGAATTGTPLGYSESAKGVPTVKISTPSVFGAATRYLGVTIDDGTAAVDNEISPRQQFVTSSYAFRAKVAESVDNLAITSGMLANSAVGSTQLAAASVTNAKLGTDAVLTTNIGNLNVTTAKIADANITTAKLADASVTGIKIASATIAAANLATGAVTSNGILDGTIATADMADGSVTTAKILDGAIATADLADNSVTTAKIANATITGTDIAAGTITNNNLGSNTVTTEENLRLVRGTVSAAAGITAGSGFTVSGGAGQYIVNLTTPFNAAPSVTVSLANSWDAAVNTSSVVVTGNGSFMVFTTTYIPTSSVNVMKSLPFHFTAIGPR